MRAFLAGIIIAVLVIGAGAAYYFMSGTAPAAVEDKPMPMEKFFANKALHAHIEKEMPKSIPIAADESAYLAGADIYQQNCAICHGLPNEDQTLMAKGMFPKPPALFKGHGVTDDPAGETYWKVANGIRLTGMPEFKHSLNDTQMWQVSLLLANADKISDAVKDKLKPPPAPGAPGAAVPPATGIPTKPGRVPISPHSKPTL
ncbi:MAG TPA: cytochrome c [Candidatus Angelobacter sp.]|nr:cytochrome c [Candidatus Angelobacter sp.]